MAVWRVLAPKAAITGPMISSLTIIAMCPMATSIAATAQTAASASRKIPRSTRSALVFVCEPNRIRSYSGRNLDVGDFDRDPAGVVRVRADNPSPLTLDGTNTYVVGGWVVDPGPRDRDHLDAVRAAAGGELQGVVLTHGHPDHAESADQLGAPVHRPGEGEAIGPFRAIATPGHSPDSVSLLFGKVCFTGDTVLGTGSVFIGPDEGSLSAYLDSLRRLRVLDLEVLCPGHGPYVWDPPAKLDEYIEHRLERERRLLDALDAGLRTRDELLDSAWSEVGPELRPFAALSLASHLDKLAEEGRLPEGVD
jgi:glyoxylase-like metal-dependent hydrolase (beta-lactamase superfamily II)